MSAIGYLKAETSNELWFNDEWYFKYPKEMMVCELVFELRQTVHVCVSSWISFLAVSISFSVNNAQNLPEKWTLFLRYFASVRTNNGTRTKLEVDIFMYSSYFCHPDGSTRYQCSLQLGGKVYLSQLAKS